MVSADTAVANTAAVTLSQELDLRGAIGGVVQVEVQFATAPTVDKTLDLYLLAGLASGGSYDDYSQGRNISLGSIKVGAVTTVQRLSLPLDAAKLCVPWGKVAVYNNGTGQNATVKSLKVSLRRVMMLVMVYSPLWVAASGRREGFAEAGRRVEPAGLSS